MRVSESSKSLLKSITVGSARAICACALESDLHVVSSGRRDRIDCSHLSTACCDVAINDISTSFVFLIASLK